MVSALNGTASGLSSSADELLLLLCDHANAVVSRDTILNVVWSGAVVEDAAITNCIWQIRKAIGDHDKQLLQTRMKRGYVLYVPASAWRAAPEAPAAASAPVDEPAAQAATALSLNPAAAGLMTEAEPASGREITTDATADAAAQPANAPPTTAAAAIASSKPWAKRRRLYWAAGFIALSAALAAIFALSQQSATTPASLSASGPDLTVGPNTVLRLTIITQDDYDQLRVNLLQRAALEAFVRGATSISTSYERSPQDVAASNTEYLDVLVETRTVADDRIEANIQMSLRDSVRRKGFAATPTQMTGLLGDYLAGQLPEPRRLRTPAAEAFAAGVAQQQRMDAQAAAEHYREAIALDPKLFEPRLALARIDLAQGRWREAIGSIEGLAQQRDLEPAQRCSLSRVMLDIAPEHLRGRASHELKRACAAE
jgi:DNA-binding winged helix-turn-helix (wHTH) protein